MKNHKTKNIALGIALGLGVCLTACDYLDVVPPEQATVNDTMKEKEDAVGFINSCYVAVESTTPIPYSIYEWSTDETVNPPLWNDNCQNTAWNLRSASNAGGHWMDIYNSLGQCHMFEQLLKQSNPLGATEEDKKRWFAEAEFLKAYYHFRLLEMYGPIPIVDERTSQGTLPEEFPGRSHFDYVVDYIVNQKLKDETIDALPNVGNAEDWGRATKSAALALKGRALLYAASDLWNGRFPYPDWKNTTYETPGYGKELVSKTKDMNKWQVALDANLKALEYAESQDGGQRKLIDLDNMPNTLSDLPLPYIPGVDTSTPEGEEFAKRVLMLRSITASNEDDGNKEIIWGVFLQSPNDNINFYAQMPKHIVCYNEASNSWSEGWCGITPTLYTVEHFYTKNGKLPEKDLNFASKEEWLTSAQIQDRPEIIKLNANREPRFYATISFDGDDYSPVICDGEPLRVNLRDSEKQGYNPVAYARDYTVTGFFTKKYIAPEIRISKVTGSDNRKNYAKPLFRLAELYLNVAECYAELGDIPNAIKYLNPIRKRAGIPELTEADITDDMTIIDWVRSERFVELWGEGHRYYDVRRWMIAPEQLKAGVREGLDVAGAGMNPSFENLNKRVSIDQPFQWDNRMYMWPIDWTEVANDPQIMQSPGY